MPVFTPHREAEGSKRPKEDQRQVQPTGQLVDRRREEDGQGQGAILEEQIHEQIALPVKDSAHGMDGVRKPGQQRENQGHSRPTQQGGQTDDRLSQRGHRPVDQSFHTAPLHPVQLPDGEDGEEDGAQESSGEGRVGNVSAQCCRDISSGAGRVKGPVEIQPHGRRQKGEEHHQPGKSAAEETAQFQTKQTNAIHWATSLEIR